MIVVFFLLLLLCLVSCKPVKFLSDLPEDHEQRMLEQVVQKFSDTLVTPGGDVAEIAELTLRPEETDALVKGVLRSLRCTRPIPDGITFRGGWENGCLVAECSVFKESLLPLCVNGRADILPEWSEGKGALQLKRFRIGHIPLPAFLGEQAWQEVYNEISKKTEYKMLAEIFIDVHVLPDGSLQMSFHPQDINPLIKLLMTGMPPENG